MADRPVCWVSRLGEAKAGFFSKAWDNAVTDASNQISGHLFKHCQDRYNAEWNEVAKQAAVQSTRIARMAAEAAAVSFALKPSQQVYFERLVRRQLIAAVHECHFADVFEMSFAQSICRWYTGGYLPCGCHGVEHALELQVW